MQEILGSNDANNGSRLETNCAIIYIMNVEIVLPLDKMTFTEKMEIIDTVWGHIRQHPEDIEWPDWHEVYLKKIEEEIASGKAKFIDFETAKKMLLEETL